MDYILVTTVGWIVLELISNIGLKQSTFKVNLINEFILDINFIFKRMCVYIYISVRSSQNLRLASNLLRESIIYGVTYGSLYDAND